MSDEERDLDALLSKVTDINWNESDVDWSLRQCKRIIQSESALLTDISVERSSIKWNKDPNSPFVEFAIPYKNNGQQSVRLSIEVLSVAALRSNPKLQEARQRTAALNVILDLAPGAIEMVRGSLPWYGDELYKPILAFYPVSEGALISAEKIEGNIGKPNCAYYRPSAPTKEQSALASVLFELAVSAPTAFKPYRAGTAIDVGDTLIYSSSLTIPSAKETEIWVDKKEGSNVTGTFYDGTAYEEANGSFERIKSLLTAICPPNGVKVVEHTTREQNRDFEIDRFTVDTAIKLILHRSTREKRDYRVYVELYKTFN